MADKDNAEESGSRSPASKLDNLSREDLVKFVKKQMVILQKTRAKCDDLSRKLVSLSEERQSSAETTGQDNRVKELETRLAEMESGKDEMLSAYNAVQSAQEQSITKFQEIEQELSVMQQKNKELEEELVFVRRNSKDLEEQFECLKMKDDSLTSTLQCLQKENQELTEQTKVLTEARDGMLEKVKTLQKEVSDEANSDNSAVVDLRQQLDQLQTTLTELKGEMAETVQVKDKLEEENSEIKDLLSSHKQELQTLKTSLDTKDTSIQDLREEIMKQSSRNGDAKEGAKELKTLCDELKEEKNKLNSKIQELSDTKTRLEDKLHKMMEELESTKSQMETVKSDLNFVVEELQQSKEKHAEDVARCEALKEELNIAKEEAAVIGRKFQEIQETVVTLKSSSEDATSGSSQNSDLENKLRSENSSLREDVQNLISQKDTLEYEVTELREEKEMLVHELASVKEQMEEWDGLMHMMKSDNEHSMGEIEHSRKETELLLTNLQEVVTDPEKQKEDERKAEVERLHSLDRTDSVSSDVVFTGEEEEEKTLVSEIKHARGLTDILIKESISLQKQLNDSYSSKGTSLLEIQALKRELEQAIAEKENIEREKESLSVVVQLSQEQEKDFAEESSTLKAEVDKLEAENQELARKLANLGDISEIEDMKVKVKEDASRIQDLEEALQNITAKADTLEKAREQLQKDVLERQQYAQELEEKLLELSSNLSNMRKRYEKVQDEKVTLEESNLQTETITSEMDSKLSSLDQRVQDLGAQKDHLNSNIEQLQKTLMEKEEYLAQLQTAKDELANINLTLKEQFACLQSEKDKLLTERDCMEENVKSLTVTLESHQAEVIDLGDKLKTQEENFFRERQSLTESVEDLQQLKAKVSELTTEIEAKDSEISHLREGVETAVSEDLQRLQHKVSDLTIEIDAKTAEILQLRKELEAKDDDVKSLLAKLTSSEEGLETLAAKEKQLVEIIEDKEKYELELNEKVNLNDSLEKEVQQLHHELSQLNSSIMEKDLKISMSEELLTSLQANVHQDAESYSLLKAETETLKGKVESLLANLSCSEETLVGVQSENSQLKALLEDKQSEEEVSLRASAEQMKLYTENMIRDLQAKDTKIETLSSRLQELEIKLKELEEENTQVQLVLSQKEEELVVLVKSKDDLQEQLEQQTVQVNLLQKETNDAQKRLVEVQSENHQLKIMLDSMKSGDKVNEQELAELRASVEHMKLDKDSANKALQAKDVEIETVTSKAHQLQAQLKELSEEKMQTELKVSQKEEELQAVVQAKDALQQQLCEQNSEVESLQKQINNGQSELMDTETLARSYKDEIYSLKETVTDNENEISNLKSEKSDVEEQLVSVQRNVETLSEERDSLLKQTSEFNEKLSHAEAEKSSTANTLSSLQKHFAQLTKKCSDLEAQCEGLSKESDADARSVKEITSLTNTCETFRQKLTLLEEMLQDIRAMLAEEDCGGFAPEHLASEDNHSALEAWRAELKGLVKGVKHKQTLLSESIESIKTEKAQLCSRLSDLQINVEETQKAEIEESTAKTDEVKVLHKQLKDKEELCNKLKALAVKGRKEVAENKTKIEVLTKENAELQNKISALEEDEKRNTELTRTRPDTQNLQQELDQLKNQLESEKTQHGEDSKNLEMVVHELVQVKEQNADLQSEAAKLNRLAETLTNEKKAQDVTASEQRTKLQALETERNAYRIQMEEMSKGKQQLSVKLSEHEASTQQLRDQHNRELQQLQAKLQDTEEKLNQAQQNAKQNSMLDLEMADYERTIENLNGLVSDRDGQIEGLQAEVDRLNGRVTSLQAEIESLDGQRLHAEDRGNKLKQLLVKTKKDLAEAKKWETEQRTSDAQLRGQLEHMTQQIEEYKVQLADISGENQKLQQRSKNNTDVTQRTVRTLEGKLQSLQDDHDLSQSQLSALQAEYDSYKVRVHNVLKQQKTKSPSELSNSEGEKMEKERLEKAVEQIRTKYEETCESLASVRLENEAIQEEHDRLSQRHNQLLQELQEKEKSFKQRLEEVTRQKSSSDIELTETVQQLSEQNQHLTHTFKNQVKQMQEEHQRTITMLQQQLEIAENENFRLQQEVKVAHDQKDSQSGAPHRATRSAEKETSDNGADYVMDIRQVERQSGEGMENVEQNKCTRVSSGPQLQSRSMSFEQLITSPVQEDAASLKSLDSVTDEVLVSKLSTAEKRVEHLTQLLSDSEVTVMRLTEQSKVLKEEIRRLERNVERENETRNLEYLKNILMKFLSLKAGDERRQLLPVLTTMLKLSPDEKTTLHSIAEGEEGSPAQSTGWGAYLHRWTSLT